MSHLHFIYILQQHRELVPGDACHRSTLMFVGAQRVGYGAQHFIANRVTIGVVDEFEAIQIHDHERQGMPLVQIHVQQIFQQIVEVAAIVDPGERVGDGEAVEILFMLPLQFLQVQCFGDVFQRADQAGDCARFIVLKRGAHLHPYCSAILGAHFELQFGERDMFQPAGFEIGLMLGLIQIIGKGALQRGFGRIAGERFPGWVKKGNEAVLVDFQQHFLHVVHQITQFELVFCQAGACFLQVMNLLAHGFCARDEGIREVFDFIAVVDRRDEHGAVPFALGNFPGQGSKRSERGHHRLDEELDRDQVDAKQQHEEVGNIIEQAADLLVERIVGQFDSHQTHRSLPGFKLGADSGARCGRLEPAGYRVQIAA